MSELFFHLGRTVGQGVIPAIRKSKWVWRRLTGNETDALRAELELGRSMVTELRLKTGTSPDPADNDLVRGIARRLSAFVRNKERTFQVEVSYVQECTAIALPGGFIFVSLGLLNFCQRDPHELAFLIGHEMGHVVRGHAMERVITRIGTEGLSALVSRGLLNPALRQVGLKWLVSAHSHDAEVEADEFAVRVMMAGGYDPNAALSLLQRMQSLRDQATQPVNYFSSHPAESERAANVASVMRRVRSHSLTEGKHS